MTRVVAVEEHFATPSLLAALPPDLMPDYPSLRWPPALERKLLDLGDERLRAMDDAGIDVQLLSLTQPALETMPASTAVPLARELNDYLAERIAEHPTRFAGVAAVPAVDPDAAADELARAVGHLGLKGAIVNGRTDGRFFDDPVFTPLLECAAALDVPVYIHPSPAPKDVARVYYAGLGDVIEARLATAAWGWHAEAGLHALRLVLAGVFDRLPTLKVMIGHMGEMIPFMLDRLERFLAADVDLARPVGDYFRTNLWYTTSGFFWNGPLQCALETVGAERLLFAVDYPFDETVPARQFLDDAPLDDRERTLISHANAQEVFKL